MDFSLTTHTYLTVINSQNILGAFWQYQSSQKHWRINILELECTAVQH